MKLILPIDHNNRVICEVKENALCIRKEKLTLLGDHWYLPIFERELELPLDKTGELADFCARVEKLMLLK